MNDPQDHLWYYRSLLAVYEQRRATGWLVDELRRTLDALAEEVAA